MNGAETRTEMLADVRRVLWETRRDREGYQRNERQVDDFYGCFPRPRPFRGCAYVAKKLDEIAVMRRAAAAAPTAPDGGWYVSIMSGKEYGLLYGPLSTQRAALDLTHTVVEVAHRVNPAQAAFARYGTARALGNRPGLLQTQVDLLLAAAKAR